MSKRVPAGAYADVARLQTHYLKRPSDGEDATAFNDQAESLKESRTAINEHEDRLNLYKGDIDEHAGRLNTLESKVAALEAQPVARFP